MFILVTTHRETGKTTRAEFETRDERIAAFARVDIHANAYRFEETGEDVP